MCGLILVISAESNPNILLSAAEQKDPVAWASWLYLPTLALFYVSAGRLLANALASYGPKLAK